jgi:glutathione S-transferase
MIVYGSSLSPFVRKTLAFAAEKGIELTLKPVGIGSPDPDFRKASPFGKMPAFSDGDFHVSDSTAIITYLDAIQPEPHVIPTDPKARARTIWFEEFADTILTPSAAKPFFNRIVMPRFLGQTGDEAAAVGAIENELPPILDYIEGALPQSGHLVEDRLTLADLAVASPFVNLAHAGHEIDAAAYPKLSAFPRRHPRPAVLRAADRVRAGLLRQGLTPLALGLGLADQ